MAFWETWKRQMLSSVASWQAFGRQASAGSQTPFHASLQTFLRQKVLSSGPVSSTTERGTAFGSGTLLYALHMRLMCAPAKGGHRKSWPRSNQDNGAEIKQGGETGHEKREADYLDRRRFYLYADLRVVFPQRRSDADDVKLHVEYDSPGDPKYFPFDP